VRFPWGAFVGALAVAATVSSCGGGGAGASAAGGFTPYDTCFPPCVEEALVSCLGPVTSCGYGGTTTCWDDGAYKTVTFNPDSSTDDIFHGPTGAACLTIHNSSDPTNGTTQEHLYDANGALIATFLYDRHATNLYAWQCGGLTYQSQIVVGCKDANGAADVLTGNTCSTTATSITCPPS
jgi:hypothetical protein